MVLLDAVSGERVDELVAAHPDVAVDPPQRRRGAVAAKGSVPGDRVVVVGVDERPVDVEDRGAHARSLPTAGGSNASTRLGRGLGGLRRCSLPVGGLDVDRARPLLARLGVERDPLVVRPSNIWRVHGTFLQIV